MEPSSALRNRVPRWYSNVDRSIREVVLDLLLNAVERHWLGASTVNCTRHKRSVWGSVTLRFAVPDRPFCDSPFRLVADRAALGYARSGRVIALAL